MGLSRAVSEINGDFDRKSQIFPTTEHLTPPLTSPTTSNSLRTVIAVSYAQPPPGHASFHGRTTSAIEVSMLLARACGTAYRRTCDET